MLKIWALKDRQEQDLPCLGALRPVEDAASRRTCLKKRVEVDTMGSYIKEIITPLYEREPLRDLERRDPNWSFQRGNCLGVLCTRTKRPAIGYVTRISGVHRFCLPVYDAEAFPSAFYHITGYMVTEDRYVAVARRNTLFWVLLGLAAGAVFVGTYLTIQYGPQGAWEELSGFFTQLWGRWMGW
ncbi:hypothetical protein [Angelakisella massiliensis]|uniref:hypothetical protein n=1 Tax=Angelakisella massiliensis TaxID=1871018 RepID=UPI0024B11321|nr:hypothetical protein [Angelakisella massiliensis]